MIGVCPACGFGGVPGVSPTSAEHHIQHRKQHLERFPRSDKPTRDALDRMVALARNGAFEMRTEVA